MLFPAGRGYIFYGCHVTIVTSNGKEETEKWIT